MAIAVDTPYRGSSSHAISAPLEDRFEVIKEIGDGSFGSVALARVRSGGTSVARRGTMVRLFPNLLCPSILTSLGRHQNNEENL